MIEPLTLMPPDIVNKDNKSMIVENTQEIHQAFEAIMENTEFSRHTKETSISYEADEFHPYECKSMAAADSARSRD